MLPQRQRDSESGTLWGEPGEDGVCRLSLETVLYQAVAQDGQAYLCAVGQSEDSPFETLPDKADVYKRQHFRCAAVQMISSLKTPPLRLCVWEKKADFPS